MYRHFLKSKIHRATVTHCELHYEGSCAIDDDLLEAADIRENEQVHVWNIDIHDEQGRLQRSHLATVAGGQTRRCRPTPSIGRRLQRAFR